MNGIELAALMQRNRQTHWTEEGLCKGDDRFTGRITHLAQHADIQEMETICAACPVLARCAQWARDEQVTDVFAAGSWRFP